MNTTFIKPQWGPLTIALMVLGFVVFWPLGLAMLAYILVTDAAYFGMTAADGSWTQADIARGRYRIEVWSPRLAGAGQMLQQEITVSPGEHAQAEIRADRALRPAQLQTRPHSWDAY